MTVTDLMMYGWTRKFLKFYVVGVRIETWDRNSEVGIDLKDPDYTKDKTEFVALDYDVGNVPGSFFEMPPLGRFLRLEDILDNGCLRIWREEEVCGVNV